MDRRWVIGALGAGALAVGGGWYLWSPAGATRAGNHPDPPPGTSFPATLSPVLFVGKAAAAYQVAREIPETLARIYCYCRCDRSVGHKSLVYCFSDDHAAGWDICQDEALDASRMVKAGSDLAAIRAAIDRKYARL